MSVFASAIAKLLLLFWLNKLLFIVKKTDPLKYVILRLFHMLAFLIWQGYLDYVNRKMKLEVEE